MGKKASTHSRQDQRDFARYGTNSYVMNKRDMSSPYVANYYAAKQQRQQYVVAQKNRPIRGYDQYDSIESGRNVGKAKTRPKELRAKRGAIVIIMLILMVAYVAVAALSFFNVLPQYTSIFVKNPGVVIVAPAEEEETEEEAAEAAGEEATGEEETTAEEETTEEESTEEAISLTNRDIVMGFVKSFVEMPAEESHFYNDAMSIVKEAGIVNKIAYYALPIAYVLALLIALVQLVRLLIAAFTPKRRKLFILGSILLFVLNIVVIATGYIWSAGTNFAYITNYIPFIAKELIPIQLGIGGLISLGISLLSLIFSFFAYRSKKKVG